MASDPYASCPCGSGKKFKWCCQPIAEQVDKAFELQHLGQHDTAIRTMVDLTKAHAANPEVWGRYAQLLHLNQKGDEAEAALEKAFAINPNYPFGHLLRGLFRQAEGEIIGALALFRRASELYAPDAREPRAFLFEQIGDIELRRNHVVASRWALHQCLVVRPDHSEMREVFDSLFGDQSRLPEAARREYKLIPAGPSRPAAWGDAVVAAASGRLTEAQNAFVQLASAPAVAADPAVWYNLGVIRAWSGDSKGAIAALDQYVAREPDEAAAADAGALIEVQRMGSDSEDIADYHETRVFFRLKRREPMVNLLQQWEHAGRLVGLRTNPDEGTLTGLVLEEVTTLIGAAAPLAAPLAAYLLITGDVLSLWHSNADKLAKTVDEVKAKLGENLGESRTLTSLAQFGDIVLDAMLFPVANAPNDELRAAEISLKMRERAEQYFESEWPHRPLKALDNVAPIDAAGSSKLRRKLLGVIRFLEQCTAGGSPRISRNGVVEQISLYDFNRLRHRLGVDTPATAPPEIPPVPVVATAAAAAPIVGGPAAAPAAAPADTPAPKALDIGAMSAADLAALDVDQLTNEQLERAYRSSLQLDARELAGKFAQSLVGRPADPSRPDLYPYFLHLIQQAQLDAAWDRALGHVEAGQAADAARNEGRRTNEFELWRARILAKKGDADGAAEVFTKLIDRAPDELKIRGTAAEAMLGRGQGKRALAFAEAGLAAARAKNNRDMEAYFTELVAAAKKQGG